MKSRNKTTLYLTDYRETRIRESREMPGIYFFFKITFNFLLQIVVSIHCRKMTMITKQK